MIAHTSTESKLPPLDKHLTGATAYRIAFFPQAGRAMFRAHAVMTSGDEVKLLGITSKTMRGVRQTMHRRWPGLKEVTA